MTGRVAAKLPEVLVTFYQGPLGGRTLWVPRSWTERRWGSRVLRVRDERDPRGFVYYRQARALRGYGVPERWQTVDESGAWVKDGVRCWPGDYQPSDADLPWAEYGAEAP